jgi:tRNA(Arg) A34 adenosine deaminase TadA
MSGAGVKEAVPTEADATYLRRAIATANASRAAGRHPFGALVVLDGEVIAEAQSLKHGNTDATSHSEMTAVRAASATRPAPTLARATLYSSTEPCAMCAGAVYWAGIGRVVYGFSEAGLRALTGAHPWNPTLALPCREVFARGSRAIEVIGPYLEDEAAVPHRGFWDAAAR